MSQQSQTRLPCQVDLNTLTVQNNQRQQNTGRIKMMDTLILEQEKQVINSIYKNLLDNVDKQYNLKLADCPWKFNNSNSRFTKYAPPYNCLDVDQLADCPIKYLAAKDCILLMWVNQSQENQAEKLLKKWGFNNHKDLMIWVKTKNGKILRNDGTISIINTKKLWICSKGSYKRFLTDNKIRQVQIADVTSHSAKPNIFLDKIKQCFKLDQMNCIELFARKRYLKEFDLYGDQLKPNFQSAQITKQINSLDNFEQLQGQLNDLPKSLSIDTTKQSTSKALEQTQISSVNQINTLQQKQQQHDFRKYIHLRKLKLSQQEKQTRINIILNTLVDNYHKQKFSHLLQKYIGIFAFKKQEFGITDLIQHDIILRKDVHPIVKAPYKVSLNEEEFIKRELDLLVQLKVQSTNFQKKEEESKSACASLIVLVRKSDGSLRLCIDYRALNKAIVRDEYPLPLIGVILQKVAKGKIFSRLDLKSSFWQLLINLEHKHLTSFTNSHGIYQWNVMPFSLINAPASFQRLMDKVLKEYINDFVSVYIDNIIIYSDDLEQHLIHLSKVFKAVDQANLRLGFDKCEFFKSSIKISGHEVSHLKYSPLKSKIDAITQMSPPIDKKGVMSFLGLVNYYDSFIPDLAIKAKPLRELTKNNVHFNWIVVQQNAFEQLKQDLDIAQRTFLHVPQQGKLMVLYTDFSKHGINAVLSLKIDDKIERVIEFASRVLKRDEYNYPACKGELLAINWAMQKFRYYLLQAPFRLIIDNLSAVQILEQVKDSNKKSSSTLNSLQKSVLRWIMQIQEFSFTPIHRQGLKHNNADALSRLPIQEQINIPRPTPPQHQILKENQPFELSYLQFTSNEDLLCCVCNKLKPEHNMVICECCGNNYHSTYHKPRVYYLPKGAWYCKQCINEIEQMQIIDYTLNFPLIQYIRNRILPDDITDLEMETLKHEAQTLYLDEHDRLVKITTRGKRIIPTIVEQKMLLQEKHHISGHMSTKKFISLLSNEYYWQSMRKNVEKFCQQCESCALFNAKYHDHPKLHPIDKGTRPCATWVMDLTSKMGNVIDIDNNVPLTRGQKQVINQKANNTYISSKGNKFLIIAINLFSKGVEIDTLLDKNSEIILNFFINSIMKRFGVPHTIKIDQGTEFFGAFHTFLKDSRIQHIQVQRAYPKANGQVERIIRTIKGFVKRYYNQPINQMDWDDSLPIIQMTQNAVASSSTKYSPHEIIFGRPMNYVSSIVIQPPIFPHQDPTKLEVTTYVKTLKRVQQVLFQKVKQNITTVDFRNKEQYDKKQRKPQYDLKQNDIVYVQLLRINKSKYPSRGPYLFIKYLNNNLNAELKQLFGQQKVVVESTANIFLYKSSNIDDVDIEE